MTNQIDFGLALQNQLSERQRRRDLKGGTERIYSRKQIEQAFIETFELVGGVQRLAMWANNEDNYGEFLKLLMRLAPKEVLGAAKGTVLEYRSNVPQSPLNRGPQTEQIVQEVEDGVFVDVSDDSPE